jgi:hypothetical protein
MKYTLILTVLLLSIFSTSAQNDTLVEEHIIIKEAPELPTKSSKAKDDYEIKTLFGGKHKANGAYGALMFNYGEMTNEAMFFMGARGCWVFNHAFSMGLGGYGLTNALSYEQFSGGPHTLINGGYGGLFLEPIIGSKLPIHVALPILLGVGGVEYADIYYDNGDYWTDATHSDVILVVEPGISVEINMTKFFRLGLNASYRYIEGVTFSNINETSLDGFSGGLSMKFGKF